MGVVFLRYARRIHFVLKQFTLQPGTYGAELVLYAKRIEHLAGYDFSDYY